MSLESLEPRDGPHVHGESISLYARPIFVKMNFTFDMLCNSHLSAGWGRLQRAPLLATEWLRLMAQKKKRNLREPWWSLVHHKPKTFQLRVVEMTKKIAEKKSN